MALEYGLDGKLSLSGKGFHSICIEGILSGRALMDKQIVPVVGFVRTSPIKNSEKFSFNDSVVAWVAWKPVLKRACFHTVWSTTSFLSARNFTVYVVTQCMCNIGKSKVMQETVLRLPELQGMPMAVL